MASSVQSQDATAALLDSADAEASDEDQTAEQGASGEGASAADNQSDTSVREIYKNSWLKQIPSTEKWSGRLYKAQKPEKFWVVFCVHDEKDPFLEFYENRRSAYSHSPLSSISLSQCLHISPTIVVQENDHEFAITLQTQVIRLAASTREQMVEWMDTMRNKLRELGILEPKDNLYSREPVASPRLMTIPSMESIFTDSQDNTFHEGSQSLQSLDLSRLSLRDPNSPLPPVPAAPNHTRSESVSSSSAVYVRNPSSVQPSPSLSSISSQLTNASSTHSIPEVPQASAQPSTSAGVAARISPPNSAFQNSGAVDNSLYEPLFCSALQSQNVNLTSSGVRNPSYENPPDPSRLRSSESNPPLPPKLGNVSRRSYSVGSHDSSESSRGMSNHVGSPSRVFTSEQSLNGRFSSSSSSSGRIIRRYSSEELVGLTFVHPPSRGHQAHSLDQGQAAAESAHSSTQSQALHQRNTSSSALDSPFPMDENGRILSLREAQVLRLQSEINHKSGVRLVLRRKDCISAVAFVECFGSVWVAGWKQKEHPLLHSAFHIGDRVVSIAGHRIHNAQEALKIIKLQTSVEIVVRRTPYAKVLAIKREYDGQDLGIVREGGTAEIKEVRPGSLALRSGLTPKAPPMDGVGSCNWFLTEINHRPLNLFFKDNEVHDRLNAVGLDISILVQPVDFVKALKKQLKAIRGYKEYTLQ